MAIIELVFYSFSQVKRPVAFAFMVNKCVYFLSFYTYICSIYLYFCVCIDNRDRSLFYCTAFLGLLTSEFISILINININSDHMQTQQNIYFKGASNCIKEENIAQRLLYDLYDFFSSSSACYSQVYYMKC